MTEIGAARDAFAGSIPDRDRFGPPDPGPNRRSAYRCGDTSVTTVSQSAGYSGTPLPRKLGIRAGSRALLDGAPESFALEPLPHGVTLHRRAGREPYDVIVTFCPDMATLTRRWAALHPRTTTPGALWVAWPKRAARMPTDLDENIVRDYGLTHGRVDVKVCAVDHTWSGLKFVIRLADR